MKLLALQSPLIFFLLFFFFFNDTATTEIYTLSLHDALPISRGHCVQVSGHDHRQPARERSEEHTSELQSRQYLVCRLLLEKKKKNVLTNSDNPTNTQNPHDNQTRQKQ